MTKVLTRLVVGVFALAVPLDAHAVGFKTDGQVGVSRAYDPAGGNGERWSVWVVDATYSTVWSRRDDPTVGFVWTDHGKPLGVDLDKEVTATGWVDAGTVKEFVFAQPSGGGTNVYMLERTNRTGTSWLQIPVGLGKTLSGNMVAAWAFYAGIRRLHLYAITTDNHLIVLERRMDTGQNTWFDLSQNGPLWVGPLAASRGPSNNYIRVYGGTAGAGTSHLEAIWFNGANGTWNGVNLGQPGGVEVCTNGGIAAAEDLLSAPITYRAYVFCSREPAVDNKVYYRFASTENGTSYSSWFSVTVPSGTLQNFGSLAATSRPQGAGRALDLWINGTNGLYRSRVIGQNHPDAPALATPDFENASRKGRLAAVPHLTMDYSYVYYFGNSSQGADEQYQLFRRWSNLATNLPFDYSNHQSGSPRQTIAPLTSKLAGSSTALYGGSAITAATKANGSLPQQFPTAEVVYSTDDYVTWNTAVIPQGTYEAVSGPAVAYDEAGTAHVVVLRQNYPGNPVSCTNAPDGAEITYFTFAAGLFSPPAVLTSGTVRHPWIDVYRDPAGPDRIHVVWERNGAIEHMTKLVPDAGWGTVHPIEAGANPTVTTGWGGKTYIAWKNHICRLNDTNDGCLPSPSHQFTNEWAMSDSDIAIPGGAQTLEMETGWSVLASRNVANRIYYAFQRNGADNRKDIWVSVGTFLLPDDFSFSFPVAVVPARVNDTYDQFSPALGLSGDNAGLAQPYDVVFVSWYDQFWGGACDGFSNRCFRARRATSLSEGLSFFWEGPIPVDANNNTTDPGELPLDCRFPNVRVHGAHHETVGDVLHTWQVVVGSPDGGAAGEAESSLSIGWASGGYFNW